MTVARKLFLFAIVGIAWWVYWTCQSKLPPKDLVSTIEEGRRVNGVILVTNREEGLDAAVMLSYEPLSGRAIIFNIPTTLCLDGTAEDSPAARKESHLPTTLESAFARESVDKLHQRLHRLLGPNLSFTAILPTDKFLRLVDLMGGLFVDVPSRISFRSDEVTTFDKFSGWIEIPEGEDVFFDSDKTRMYLAYRFDGLGMRGQMFRARRLAMALVHRLKPHLDYDWFKMEFLASFSNVSTESAYRLFKEICAVPASSLDVQLLPGQPDLNSGVYWASKKDLIKSLPKELKPLVQGAPKSRIVVQLLNGSGAPNLAARLREQLSAYPEVDIVEMGNASRRDYETTLIIDRGGHMPSAQRIRDLLGAGVLSQDVNPKALLDVTVVIGKDIR